MDKCPSFPSQTPARTDRFVVIGIGSGLERRSSLRHQVVRGSYSFRLAEEADPDDVKRGACRELSEIYGVFPDHCRSLIAGLPGEREYLDRALRLREDLRHGGIVWVRARFQWKDEAEVFRYLHLLSQSGDAVTAAIAKRLLNSQKRIPKQPP
jgi:hypothetical protein